MIKDFYLTVVLCCLFFHFTAQKGIQIGFGAGTLLMDYTKDFGGIHKKTLFFNPGISGYEDTGITGNNPYFMELNLDYVFNKRIRIKSGVQYRARKLEQFNSWKLTTTVFSFPLIFNYCIPISAKNSFTLGLNLGLTWDRYMTFKGGYTNAEQKSGNIGKYTKLYPEFYNGKINYLNGSWRYGINLEKDLGADGRISLQIMYSYNNSRNRAWYNFDLVQKTYSETNSSILLATNTTNIFRHNAGESGLIVGMNYYFGQLVFNRK